MQKWLKTSLFLYFVLFLTNDAALAQKIPAKTDSTTIYKDIESFSKKRKFTKFMYQIFFKQVADNSNKKGTKKKVYKKLLQKPYSAFEGKIIRKIDIETLDPFGFSIADTIVVKQNSLSKNANKIHIKTQRITIRNLLLIRQNQVFDSLKVKESERLVRRMGYVTDVSFFVTPTKKNSDSVDIFIRELDKWSLIPSVAASTSRITLNLNEKNFLGLGHESQNSYTWNHTTSQYAYKLNYYIPNIDNTYINATFHMGTEESGNYIRSVSVDRPFFSPLAKWAAGINFSHQFSENFMHITDSIYMLQRFKFNTQDYWAGNAMQIFKGNSVYNRTTNFISALRYSRTRFTEKPIETNDLLHGYSDEDFYLASVGVSTRRYVLDRYIFKYGLTEDVPIGSVYNLTGGYQKKNKTGRIYLGGRISFGNYFPWGYFSLNSEYGTFLNASHAEQGVISLGVNYFTGLLETGKWKFRQFLKPQVIIGINPFVYDSITLNDGYGLDGFNSTALTGTSRLIFTVQTQSYSPWNFIGFRFGPFFTLAVGMLGDAETGFKNSKAYSQIGFGVLIKNENLVINTFQLSFAFYPAIPGKGQDIIKFNSFSTTDFGFRDFEIGKPVTVPFR